MYQEHQYRMDLFLASLPIPNSSAVGRAQLFGSFFMYNLAILPEGTPDWNL